MCVIVLYNVLLRIARNLLKTRENIKIENWQFWKTTQSKLLGYPGWVEILIITLVYSKRVSVRNNLLHSVTLHLHIRSWIFWQLMHDQSKMCKNASVWTVLNFDWRSLKNRYDQTIFLLLPSQREPSVNVHIDVTSDALNFVANTVVT